MYYSTLQQVQIWILKIGLWILPIIPLIISETMLFPFITGKNFTFRIVIEILFILWIWLILSRPEFRPRWTPLFTAVTVFIVVLFVADLLGANPYRSFFSNFERMEGFMMLGHLYLYFVMLTSVFRTSRDWMVFFHATLAVSVVVSFIALMQKVGLRPALQGGFRVDSTIGNPTYLAAYLLFHVWLLFFLIYEFWKKWWLEAIYISILLFELAIIYFTATRGVVLALAFIGFLFLVSLVLFWKKVFPQPSLSDRYIHKKKYKEIEQIPSSSWPRWRKITVGFLVGGVLFGFFLWQVRESEFVQSHEALQRLTNYSLNEGTIQARFMIWGMSWEGFKERPILGWGQENYYLVFQKYFNPGLFGEEPWFDRSHNVFFDWLINAGLLGLLAYLSIFFIAFWMIARGMRRGSIAWLHGFVLFGLFLSYGFQNLFVFDNLNTYLLFFFFLAYTEYITRRHPEGERVGLTTHVQPIPSGYQYGIVSILAVGMFINMYFINIQPIFQSQALIQALQVPRSETPDKLISAFERALAYQSFGDTEAREQLHRIARQVVDNALFSEEDRMRFVEFARTELKKETEKESADVKHFLFLGSLLWRSGNLNSTYIKEAEDVLTQAMRLSPGKQLVALELAQLYLSTGRAEPAVEVLARVWNMKREFPVITENVWIAAVLAGAEKMITEIKTYLENTDKKVNMFRIALAYSQIKDFSSALTILEELIQGAPDIAQYHAVHAAFLAEVGRFNEARTEIEEAVRLDSGYQEQADQFFKLIEGR